MKTCSVPGNPAPPASLRASRLSVTLAGQQVLSDIDLLVPDARVSALCGPNGCGKSTLLRVLAGLIRPQAGSVWLGDRLISAMTTQERARQLAILGQSPLLPTSMTVAELVACGRFVHTGLTERISDGNQRWISWAIRASGLTALRDQPLSRLSGGQRQLARIAMALAQGSHTLLLDEPTTFLDIHHQMEILQRMRALSRAHGLTVLWVLHDLNQAAAFSDHMVLMRDGRVHAEGPPATLAVPAVLSSVFGVDMCAGLIDGQPVCLPRMNMPAERPPCAP